MGPLLLGVAVVVAIYFLLKWYSDADVKQVKSSAKWIGASVLILGIVVLAGTGRLGAAMGLLMAFFAWAWRVFHMVSSMRQFTGMFRSFGFGRGFGAGPGSANASHVTSAFLNMTLDLSSGAMDGEVTAGRARGRRLSQMPLADLMKLLNEVASDADSVNLLEAFLDRGHPDWRETQGPGPSAPPATSGSMSRDEALRILGLKDGAGPEEVKTAYRKLMAQLHPDRGGSDYLAAKVNQAKDFLLKGTSS
ncbi:MAG: DnaJ domain-containing protein [Rhodospirillaceae bacterium]